MAPIDMESIPRNGRRARRFRCVFVFHALEPVLHPAAHFSAGVTPLNVVLVPQFFVKMPHIEVAKLFSIEAQDFSISSAGALLHSAPFR
jgi:hypothetical protein